MKVKLRGIQTIGISGEYIRLDTLLKLASVATTGGEAKIMVQSGEVCVDGEVCTMRGKKIRPENVVRRGGDTLLVKNAIKERDSDMAGLTKRVNNACK